MTRAHKETQEKLEQIIRNDLRRERWWWTSYSKTGAEIEEESFVIIFCSKVRDNYGMQRTLIFFYAAHLIWKRVKLEGRLSSGKLYRLERCFELIVHRMWCPHHWYHLKCYVYYTYYKKIRGKKFLFRKCTLDGCISCQKWVRRTWIIIRRSRRLVCVFTMWMK